MNNHNLRFVTDANGQNPGWACKKCAKWYPQSVFPSQRYEPPLYATGCCVLNIQQLTFRWFLTKDLKTFGVFKYGTSIITDQIEKIEKQWLGKQLGK